ncbi:hypothetical protein PI124_g3996 [Phytophthora idaei]|nr:hypothetical protein PI125_g23807 [Phytophthora idaei]KAG3134873.1 hypothetical protein PI126_g18508 [Phytophthora idaei]KAG3251358.1 hypothetical protein PI124_g3996 [Phytophthora idaei]
MQRTRYRRTTIKTKKKMAETEKKSQNRARKKERFELVYSSPHIVENPAASTSADTKASASGYDDATAPVELVTTKDISPTSARSEPQEIPPAATTCEVEDSAHVTGVSTQREPPTCICHTSASTQYPQEVYIEMQAVPLQFGAASRLCLA